MAFLLGGNGERYQLSGDELRVGRARDCEICIIDTSVSRNHARIRKTPEGHLILDEGSENGLIVNRQRVKQHLLRDGDRIKLGNFDLRYVADVPIDEALLQTPPPVRVVPTITPPAPAIERAPAPSIIPSIIPPDPPKPGTPAKPRSAARRWIALVLLAIAIVAGYRIIRIARGPETRLAFRLKADRSVAKIAPELAPLGPMTRVRVEPQVAEFTPAGGKVKIKDGAQLHVPADAFSSNVKLETSVISLGLEHFDFSMRDSWAYVIKTTGADKIDLKKTITLEIPYRPEVVRVAQLNGDTWQRIDVPPGRTTKVTIGHFSSKIFEVAKSNVAEEESPETSGPTIQPSEPEGPTPGIEAWEQQKEKIERAKKLMRERLEGSNESTKRFYGVGDQAKHSTEENCRDLTSVLDDFKKDPKNFEMPPDFANASCSDLGINWLFPGQIPSKEPDNYYWRVVSSSMDAIRKSVLASDRPLTEAQVLRIAIVANNGNVLMGILAAHNFLKDITYKGRVYPNGNTPNVPDDLGELASHLESWRHNTNVSPAGEYDKMGPIYHLFAAATARAWCGAVWGSVAINGESASRALGTMGDKYDVEKGDADTCGRDFGATVAELLPTTINDPHVPLATGSSVPAPPLWKYAPNPVTGEKAPCPPIPVASFQRRLCPWSPKDVSAEPCSAGFCWDGGFRGTLACKPEKDVPGGYRNDLNNILCPAGSHLVLEECSGVPTSCESDH